MKWHWSSPVIAERDSCRASSRTPRLSPQPLLKFSPYENKLDEALAERELKMLNLPRLMTTLMLAGGMLLLNGAAAPVETRGTVAVTRTRLNEPVELAAQAASPKS
jgi:hypothetical protein